MKQLASNLKHGEMKLQVENLDDLWYLSNLVEERDLVKGKTTRKIKIGDNKEGNVKVVKKTVFIEIKVEKVEFSKTSNILRVSGVTTQGPEDIPKGSHHTINVEEQTILKIKKEKWLTYQIKKLKEACSEKQAKILICVFDREEAYFALVKKYNYDVLSHIEGDVQKKDDDKKPKKSFYQEIINQLIEYKDRHKLDTIVIASPAFWKEDLMKELKNDELKKIIIQATSSSATKNAIDEVLRRDEVKQALQQDRISKEMKFVEELLNEIKNEDLAVYGIKDCENAANAGAVKVLLVSDSLIQKTREQNKFGRLNSIMKVADDTKAEVIIVSSEHDGGRKLGGLGGIGAILRYKLNY